MISSMMNPIGKARQPVPEERRDSIRRVMTAILEKEVLSARDISRRVGIPEKTVHEHLEHIRKSLDHRDLVLKVTPAECSACGFVFKKRNRLTRPSRCPVCKSESIEQPLFAIGAR